MLLNLPPELLALVVTFSGPSPLGGAATGSSLLTRSHASVRLACRNMASAGSVAVYLCAPPALFVKFLCLPESFLLPVGTGRSRRLASILESAAFRSQIYYRKSGAQNNFYLAVADFYSVLRTVKQVSSQWSAEESLAYARFASAVCAHMQTRYNRATETAGLNMRDTLLDIVLKRDARPRESE